MIITTFDHFWHTYHCFTNQRKINKDLSLKYWNSIVSIESKRNLLKSLRPDFKSNMNAYDYLKANLKY